MQSGTAQATVLGQTRDYAGGDVQDSSGHIGGISIRGNHSRAKLAKEMRRRPIDRRNGPPIATISATIAQGPSDESESAIARRWPEKHKVTRQTLTISVKSSTTCPSRGAGVKS